MPDDEPDLPRLAVFPAAHPYGDTTIILNRSGAESLMALLKDVLEKKDSSDTFYQHPEEDSTDTQRVHLSLASSSAMDRELISQFPSHFKGDKLGPTSFTRKHCKCEHLTASC
jgi:hypothetical protein